MIDIRQSQNYANYLRSLGWIVERQNEINYFIKKFPIIGSVLKVQRPSGIQYDTINKLCRKYRIFQIIVEPDLATGDSTSYHELMLSHGFKLSKSPYLPTKTLQINLTQSQKIIFSHFKKDARSTLLMASRDKRAMALSDRRESKGIGATTHQYSTPDEIRKFREAWKKSVNYKRYVPPLSQLLNLRKSFPADKSLFLASHNISGRIIGGVIFTRSSHDFAYYWQAFTNSEGRTSLSQYSLLWQGILWAKKMGCKVFDFEGIYDPRFPNKSWLGFTHFKRSFGGIEVEYPGTFINNRLSFWLWKLGHLSVTDI